MPRDLILRGDGFSLEFLTRKKITSSNYCEQAADDLPGDNGYVLQERIIVPPHLVNQANKYSLINLNPDRCNPPLIFIGHHDLPVQCASVIARIENEKSIAEKSDKAIRLQSEGINILYSAPLFSIKENTPSFITEFNQMSEILHSFQMRESDIVRTWLFMDDILKDYEKLNTSREQFFAKWYCSGNEFLPASTGIQGHTIGNDRLAVEFCAFSGSNISIRQISSPLQDEPTAYGKLFSRAVVVEIFHSKLIFISGTAAIDKKGFSVYNENFESQMRFTLEIISAILKQENCGFSNVAQAIVYLKRTQDIRSCLFLLDKAGFPRDRTLFQVSVDVCRDDLLCEIEVTAILD